MPTFERCDNSVDLLAKELINKFESHQPLVVAGVKIDFVFARADRDEESGEPMGVALTKNGIRALGIARKIPLKDRALGRGDAEIALDGDYWGEISGDEQAALLDHELHHVAVVMDKNGNIKFDDLGRPQIKMRKHDVEVGWFKEIARRHGQASIEQQQAKSLMDNSGQFFWPDMAPTVAISTGDKTVTLPIGTFAKAAAKNV